MESVPTGSQLIATIEIASMVTPSLPLPVLTSQQKPDRFASKQRLPEPAGQCRRLNRV